MHGRAPRALAVNRMLRHMMSGAMRYRMLHAMLDPAMLRGLHVLLVDPLHVRRDGDVAVTSRVRVVRD